MIPICELGSSIPWSRSNFLSPNGFSCSKLEFGMSAKYTHLGFRKANGSRGKWGNRGPWESLVRGFGCGRN